MSKPKIKKSNTVVSVADIDARNLRIAQQNVTVTTTKSTPAGPRKAWSVYSK